MKLAKIRQLFEHKQLIGPADEIASLIESKKFQAAIAGKKRIAIGLGSRGISNIVPMVKQLIASLKAAGAEPVIVPAMGSHGTATAEGQIMVLSKLGITEETIGAKIISSMDVILLGKAAMDGKDYEVFIDQAAWQADGVILINRIKTHTDFIATYESGLVKMATVGLGNRKGALQVHSLGTPGLTKLMPALAEVVFADDKFIGGFAIIEDAYHDTAAVHWLSSDEILPKEPELLEESKSLMPYFPIDDIDLLIVKRMGKEISGVGLDPKVLGRLMVWGENELPQPRIELLAICDITDASYGNALGVGLGDFITRRLFERIDFAALKENINTDILSVVKGEWRDGPEPGVSANALAFRSDLKRWFKGT